MAYTIWKHLKIEIEIGSSIEIPSPCGRGQRGVTFLVISHPLLNPLPLRERKLLKIFYGNFGKHIMSAKDETNSRLSESPVFVGIPEEKLLEISRIARRKIVPAHTIIFRQDEPGESFYIINSGKVRVYRKNRDGFETHLAYLGQGESFGELALITGKPRSGFIETSEETDLTVIPRDQFDRILKDYPHISSAFVKQLSGWLTQNNFRLEMETVRQFWVPGVSWIDFFVIIGLSLVLGIVFNLSNPHGIRLIPQSLYAEAVPAVNALLAAEKYKEGKTLFVDARPSNLFEQQHVKGAINLPSALFDIMYMMELSGVDKEKEIIVYGRTISSLYDEDIARKLILRGHKNTKILQGGLPMWKRNRYPVES